MGGLGKMGKGKSLEFFRKTARKGATALLYEQTFKNIQKLTKTIYKYSITTYKHTKTDTKHSKILT